MGKLNFSGCIDVNTSLVLDDITEEEFNGMKKFIEALDHADCSWVSIDKCDFLKEDKNE